MVVKERRIEREKLVGGNEEPPMKRRKEVHKSTKGKLKIAWTDEPPEKIIKEEEEKKKVPTKTRAKRLQRGKPCKSISAKGSADAPKSKTLPCVLEAQDLPQPKMPTELLAVHEDPKVVLPGVTPCNPVPDDLTAEAKLLPKPSSDPSSQPPTTAPKPPLRFLLAPQLQPQCNPIAACLSKWPSLRPIICPSHNRSLGKTVDDTSPCAYSAHEASGEAGPHCHDPTCPKELGFNDSPQRGLENPWCSCLEAHQPGVEGRWLRAKRWALQQHGTITLCLMVSLHHPPI
ncbi:uncharacterized protein [Erythrolamprus reginae]|uniref:uncharacterized protein n=1 Tax=Erythrolamprus reginae TaxID=121349 RepID=UPI00396C8BDF